jgi:hypothetical protein
MSEIRYMMPKKGDTVYVCERTESGWGPMTPRKVYQQIKYFFFVERDGVQDPGCVFLFGGSEGMLSCDRRTRVFLDENPPQVAINLALESTLEP